MEEGGSDVITRDDVEKVDDLFRAAQLLRKLNVSSNGLKSVAQMKEKLLLTLDQRDGRLHSLETVKPQA